MQFHPEKEVFEGKEKTLFSIIFLVPKYVKYLR